MNLVNRSNCEKLCLSLTDFNARTEHYGSMLADRVFKPISWGILFLAICFPFTSLDAWSGEKGSASLLSSLAGQRLDAKNVSEPILIDFGIGEHESQSPDLNGNWWNNLSTDSAQAPTASLSNLVTRQNTPSGIQVNVSGFGNGANIHGTTLPDIAALGSLGVISATRDNFFVDANPGTLTLNGLSPNFYYRLECFGSRDALDSRVTLYTATGLNTVSATLETSGAGIGAPPQSGANRSGLAVLENIRPTQAGLLTLTTSVYYGQFGYLGAMRITQLDEVSASNLPPEASNVIIVGAPAEERTITVKYDYNDAEGDSEGDSIIDWQFDTPPFSNPLSLITGLSPSIQLPNSAGTYVRAAITPVAISGENTGSTQYSQWLGPIAVSNATTIFHIGNSLTRWGDIPLQLHNLALDAGQVQVSGEQLTDGMGLAYHWLNGMEDGVWTQGTPSRLELETGSWDWLVLQPMSREWQPAHLDNLIDHALLYANLATANGTKVLLYQYWNYEDEDELVQDDINAAFFQVHQELTDNGINALIIPSGEAFANAVSRIPGLTKNELYQDNIHPSDSGYYLSALMHYAVIYRQSPLGLTNAAISSGFDTDDPILIDPDLASDLQQVAWDTARYHSQSGITLGRFSKWAAALPPEMRGLMDVPFSDGVSNIRRWAHGLPIAEAQGLERLPQLQINSGMAVLEYGRSEDATDAGVIIEDQWAATLTDESWSPIAPPGSIRSQIDDRIQWLVPASWRSLFHRNRIITP